MSRLRVGPASTGPDNDGADSAGSGSAGSGSAGPDSGGPGTVTGQIWRDPSRPAAERVKDLLSRMTLEEKVAQLTSIWIGDESGDGDVAPVLGGVDADPQPLSELIRYGLGQVTRVFGTRPLPPAVARSTLRELQAEISGASRFGIPAVAHEECLTGFAAWTATVFPTPLAWGASFDPELVREMAGAIGASMRSVGIHQGLAPVLDVARDMRWGRIEETIGEDPYLVGLIGTGYVRGLQSAGLQATLKHFAGYSASRAGRNMAPVSMGPREFADVLLVPFEMALRLGGARSVMPAYPDVDGVPASGDRALLTGLLRDELGFDGVVVSDYWAISYLQTEHGVAATTAQAAALALDAGLDVELPRVGCYGAELVAAVRDGQVPAELVERAAARVLRQKCDLGLLDEDWSPAFGEVNDSPVDLDPPGHRALARRLAEESVVLLANGGDGDRGAVALPLRPDARIAVIGPLANDPLAFFGCYSMARHLGNRYPEAADGVHVTTLLDALAAELPGASISHAVGCHVRGEDRSGFAAAAEHAREADVVVAVLGDQAGLFGRGTSGEGCDAPDLRLPGVQEDLLGALTATGTPVVLVLVTGRPYAIGPAAGELAAAVQAFFPGEEGGTALAGVLSGRVVPSGRLPVEIPALAGSQPSSYLRPRLAGRHRGSSIDPDPLFAFGHGLSYTSFTYADLVIRPAEKPADSPDGPADPARIPVGTEGTAEIACTVRNTGSRAGAEVVQLYLSDPVAQVVRPVRWLAGFARVALEPGQARRVTFRLHADRTAFCGRDGTRVVEPGEIRVAVGGASDRPALQGSFTLCGAERPAGPDRVLDTPVVISDPIGKAQLSNWWLRSPSGRFVLNGSASPWTVRGNSRKINQTKRNQPLVAAIRPGGGKQPMAAVFDVADFLHPLDTSARRQLESVPMLEPAVKKYLSAVKERRTHQALLVNALRLGPHQLPDIYKMLPPICEAFGIAEPELYLMQGQANAVTVGHTNAAIVIYSGLLEDLGEDEIQAVIAHECGHIMAQHTLYRQMAAAMVGAGETVAGSSVFGQAAGIAIQSTLANWYRKSEFTADRAAVAFFGDPEPLQRALFHLLGVPKWMPAEVSYSVFIEQAGEFDKITESKWDRFLARSLESGSSHPLPALRMRELTTWAQSHTFEQLMEIAKHGNPRERLACGQCGQRLLPEWRFCQFCGAAVPQIATSGTGDQREPV